MNKGSDKPEIRISVPIRQHANYYSNPATHLAASSTATLRDPSAEFTAA